MNTTEKIYYRASEIALKYGMGKSTVWKWSAQGKLPKPQKLATKLTVWRADEVDSAMEDIMRVTTQDAEMAKGVS